MSQRYKLKGKIGHGGFAEVYLAVDTQLGREVALKRVKSTEAGEEGAANLAEDLMREARILSALQHPNIVTIFDVGRDENGPFVVMELLKGETLDSVGDRGKLSVDDFTQVALQTMEGMVAAQSRGLVHRDLKPGNLMVNWLASGRFQVKILDFGLAKFSQMPTPQAQDQGSGIFGSIYFMAPEQFERLPLDGRTDLYSLGCIFYLVLAQKHPFEGRSPVDVMVSHLQHLVTPLHGLRQDIPQWMADWVMWLMARDMDARPTDAQQALAFFVQQKAGLKTGTPVPAPATAVPGAGPSASAQLYSPAIPKKAEGFAAQPMEPAPPPPSADSKTQPMPAPAAGAKTAPLAVNKRPRPTGHMSARSSRPGAHRVFRERFSPISFIAGTVLLAICLGATWYVYRDGQKKRPTPLDVLELVKGESPQGNYQTVKDLVNLAASGYGKTPEETEKSIADALAGLKRVRGESVAPTIAKELKDSSGDLRDRLISIASSHKSKDVAAALMDIAENDAGENRKKALTALKNACDPNDLDLMIPRASKFTSDEDSRAFWGSVEGVLSTFKHRGSRAKALAPFLKTIDLNSRSQLLRVVGANGSPEASAALATEFGVGGERAAAAAEALRMWSSPDDTVAAAAFDAARTGDRDLFVGAYARTIARIPTYTPADVVKGLKKILGNATTLRSRKDFLSALGNLTGKEAIEFATELTQSADAAMADEAQLVLEQIKKQTESVITLIPGENKIIGSAAIIAGDATETRWDPVQEYITGWRSARTRIVFDFIVPKNGEYKIEIFQSAVEEGFTYSATVGSNSFENPVMRTESSDDFQRLHAGTFTINREGPVRFWLEPVKMEDRTTLMNVRSIVITAP